jgi:thiol:disulfide interchange protein
MKKTFFLLAIASFGIFALAGCGKTTEKTDTAATQNTAGKANTAATKNEG